MQESCEGRSKTPADPRALFEDCVDPDPTGTPRGTHRWSPFFSKPDSVGQFVDAILGPKRPVKSFSRWHKPRLRMAPTCVNSAEKAAFKPETYQPRASQLACRQSVGDHRVEFGGWRGSVFIPEEKAGKTLCTRPSATPRPCPMPTIFAAHEEISSIWWARACCPP